MSIGQPMEAIVTTIRTKMDEPKRRLWKQISNRRINDTCFFTYRYAYLETKRIVVSRG